MLNSKTRESACAYKARYCDGKVIPAKPGGPAEPEPCAGNPGTTIRRAFKNPAEQHAHILDVVTRYAVHYGDKGVAFACKRDKRLYCTAPLPILRTDHLASTYCYNYSATAAMTHCYSYNYCYVLLLLLLQKHGAAGADISTPAASTTLANIKIAYGAALGRELLEFEASHQPEVTYLHAWSVVTRCCKLYLATACVTAAAALLFIALLTAKLRSQQTLLLEAAGAAPASEADVEQAPFSYSAKGYVTNANFSTKRPLYKMLLRCHTQSVLQVVTSHVLPSQRTQQLWYRVLYICATAVGKSSSSHTCACHCYSCTHACRCSIRRTMESVYSGILPKGTHPFIYLAITMPPQHLDVNVHPTKREVHFLHEEALLAALHSALEAKLMGANQSRTFYTQSVLPGVHFDTPAAAAAAVSGTAAQSSSSSKAAAAASARKRARSSATTAAASGRGNASDSDREGDGDALWQPYDEDNDVSAHRFVEYFESFPLTISCTMYSVQCSTTYGSEEEDMSDVDTAAAGDDAAYGEAAAGGGSSSSSSSAQQSSAARGKQRSTAAAASAAAIATPSQGTKAKKREEHKLYCAVIGASAHSPLSER
eukprot:19808-Heterococcus_DN1.PRE.3